MSMYNTLSKEMKESFDYWLEWSVDMEYCLQHRIGQRQLRANDELVEAFLAEYKQYTESLKK